MKNEVYVGTVVQGKCTTPNYKVKKRVYKDESEWVRVGDAHEAIVGRSEFDLVQSLSIFPTSCAIPGARLTISAASDSASTFPIKVCTSASTLSSSRHPDGADSRTGMG